jgi:hypothetical protein
MEHYRKSSHIGLPVFETRNEQPAGSLSLPSANSLFDLYEAWDKPEEAEKWRAILLQTEAVQE